MNAPMKVSVLSTRASNSDQQARLGGKIRAGIKVLTNKAKSNAKAVAIYDDGVNKRLKFSEIEKRIKDETGLENAMYPRNTPYFNVASSDFGMPEIAQLIVDTYGEVREHDEQKQLYRFPVVFHSDDLNAVYPNQFKRHGHEPHYESHYGEDGVRYCRYLPEVSNEQAAAMRVRRIKKLPRREKVIRGTCDPATCNEFLQGQCKFRGRLLFYIPGIPSTGLIGMETSSEYAAEGIWADLERIRDALGTIPRYNPKKPGEPIFWITKFLEPRTYFDANGEKKNGFQWVPKLQADIDIGAVLTSGAPLALPRSDTPVAWLSQPKGMPGAPLLQSPDAGFSDQVVVAQPIAQVDVEPTPQDQLDALITKMGLNEDLVMEYFDAKIAQSWEKEPAHVRQAIHILGDLERKGPICAAKLINISLKATRMGLNTRDFNAYAFAKHGRGFTGNEAALDSLLHDLANMAEMPLDQAAAMLINNVPAAFAA